MKLQIAVTVGLFTALLAPGAGAETKPATKPVAPAAHSPGAPQAVHSAAAAAVSARSTHPATALHAVPHSKNQTPPPSMRLPQLPPPDQKPTTPVTTTITSTPATVAPTTTTGTATTGTATTAAKPGAVVPVKPPCLKVAVSFTRGIEEDKFSLAKCDGSAAPESVEHLSVLARSGDAVKPSQAIAVLAKVPGENVAPGIRRIDARLVERLQLVVDKFMKPAQTQKLHLISGYRPNSLGSFHATARAIDFRMDGVTNEELVAFCKSLPDTGCGYYPNSSFIHMDVRESGTGHVTWIDASGPGESPRYVPTWPPPKVDTEDAASFIRQLLGKSELPAGTDETPADTKSAAIIPPPPPAPDSQ